MKKIDLKMFNGVNWRSKIHLIHGRILGLGGAEGVAEPLKFVKINVSATSVTALDPVLQTTLCMGPTQQGRLLLCSGMIP